MEARAQALLQPCRQARHKAIRERARLTIDPVEITVEEVLETIRSAGYGTGDPDVRLEEDEVSDGAPSNP